MTLIKPAGYRNLLGSTENTEKAIKHVKDMFQENLSAQLALLRVTAPMVVLTGTGINDDLNGIERPVAFPIKDMDERRAEVVHSLAKWKRLKLGEMNIKPGRGIYTDMNALRPDEVVKSTMTHHWRVLRDSGVIWQRPQGRENMISLRREDLDARFPGLMAILLQSKS